jgi:hypothetical protein
MVVWNMKKHDGLDPFKNNGIVSKFQFFKFLLK